eukprot:scaffold124399_cov21-Tisochrysis_lutea.AAC.1
MQRLTPHIPIISEENAIKPYEVRQNYQYHWLVDPLDGTKEFLKRNGEFTVNIALVTNGIPVLGVVHVPCQAKTYVSQNQCWCWAACAHACVCVGLRVCVTLTASLESKGRPDLPSVDTSKHIKAHRKKHSSDCG